MKIGDHYLRLLLEDDPKTTKIHKPVEFFNDLYHRFLLTTVPAMKAMCLQALAIVYGQCYEDIGNFNDTEYIVTMLNRCEDNMERDRLLEFLAVLLRNTKNVKLFIDAGGLRALTDLVTLAHLHTTRATVPLQNDMLQASSAQLADDEAEWYYSMSKDSKERKGPVGFVKLKEMCVSYLGTPALLTRRVFSATPLVTHADRSCVAGTRKARSTRRRGCGHRVWTAGGQSARCPSSSGRWSPRERRSWTSLRLRCSASTC